MNEKSCEKTHFSLFQYEETPYPAFEPRNNLGDIICDQDSKTIEEEEMETQIVSKVKSKPTPKIAPIVREPEVFAESSSHCANLCSESLMISILVLIALL